MISYDICLSMTYFTYYDNLQDLFYNWKLYLSTTFIHFAHPPPHVTTTNLPSLSMSLYFLFCFLYSTSKWDNIVFVFILSDLYHFSLNSLKVYSYCYKWQDFLLFYDWLINISLHILYHLSIYPSMETDCFHVLAVIN